MNRVMTQNIDLTALVDSEFRVWVITTTDNLRFALPDDNVLNYEKFEDKLVEYGLTSEEVTPVLKELVAVADTRIKALAKELTETLHQRIAEVVAQVAVNE